MDNQINKLFSLLKPQEVLSEQTKQDYTKKLEAGKQESQMFREKITNPFFSFADKSFKKIMEVMNPGSSYVEPALKKIGVNPLAAAGIGLGIDVLAPGPGELGRAADKASDLIKGVSKAEDLVSEAKKYKTAEEFVKAQTSQNWSKLQQDNPDLFNRGILRKSQAPKDAVGEIPKDVHTMQGKWQNYGQDAEISADKVYNKIDKYGDYVDENDLPIRNQKTGDYLQSNKEWDDYAGNVERTTISNQQLKDEFIKSFSTPEGKKYLNEVVKALPKNPDGSITAYRIGNIGGEGAQSYTLSEGMAKTFSHQGTDIPLPGTPGLPKGGYKDFGVLPTNTVKIDPKGIVAWSPYDAEILVEPKYVKTKSQLTDIWKKANKK